MRSATRRNIGKKSCVHERRCCQVRKPTWTREELRRHHGICQRGNRHSAFRYGLCLKAFGTHHQAHVSLCFPEWNIDSTSVAETQTAITRVGKSKGWNRYGSYRGNCYGNSSSDWGRHWHRGHWSCYRNRPWNCYRYHHLSSHTTRRAKPSFVRHIRATRPT